MDFLILIAISIFLYLQLQKSCDILRLCIIINRKELNDGPFIAGNPGHDRQFVLDP